MLRTLICSDRHERAVRAKGATLIAGVDEVGRGALFGPVVAAAVILPPKTTLNGLRDSKQLTALQRERLCTEIQSLALAISIAEIDAATIDRVNIYQATRLAMTAAVSRLNPKPDHLLIDAMRLDHPCPQTSIVYGDSLSISIAAASVIAKVHRDNLMCRLDAQFPQYGIARHKGYGTAEHRAALLAHGPSPLHRKSFAPVAQSNLFEE
ncbi:MAG: ribonuclease HII [Acidobacteriaceae bacterium]